MRLKPSSTPAAPTATDLVNSRASRSLLHAQRDNSCAREYTSHNIEIYIGLNRTHETVQREQKDKLKKK